MIVQDIEALDCSKTYGNPSGHSMTVSCFYTSVFLLLYFDKDFTVRKRLLFSESRESFSSQNSIVRIKTNRYFLSRLRSDSFKKFWFWITLTILVFLIVSVAVSRVALGAHGINQVIYGTLLGLWLALALFYYLRPFLQVHIRSILEFDTREFVI